MGILSWVVVYQSTDLLDDGRVVPVLHLQPRRAVRGRVGEARALFPVVCLGDAFALDDAMHASVVYMRLGAVHPHLHGGPARVRVGGTEGYEFAHGLRRCGRGEWAAGTESAPLLAPSLSHVTVI